MILNEEKVTLMAEQLLYKLKVGENGVPYLSEDGRRYWIDKRKIYIDHPLDVYELARKMGYTDDAEESFCILCLNVKNRTIAVFEVAHGSQDACYVQPYQVFQRALMVGANSIICWHNHPSGSLEISDSDIQITKRLAEAGRLIGIPIIEHLIITRNSYSSMLEDYRDIFEVN